ncbi:MAG TPA: hypothetical protein VLE51_00940 [Candidatus Saccharimonadales bacterium]|nr:hypothetical protein [Candidatus Saccharimonadales bacterium]
MRTVRFLLLIPFLIVAAITAILIIPNHSGASFTANRLMDDGVMDNYNTMNASQIDSWLNTNFPNSCISTNHGFTAAVPSGYSPSTGYTYGGYGSAGAVIYAAAQAYEINPRVLIVTLQKEESLVAGDAGCSVLRYTAATGYGCPDGGTTYSYSNMNPALYAINGTPVNSVSGTCVNNVSKAGFSQQVIRAAWLLKFGEQRSEGNTGWAIIKGSWDNSDDPQTCYGGPMTQGYHKRCTSDSTATYYDGYVTIDGSSTHMDTGPTAALYWYTPHFAGNQNFVNLFESWFGPTKGYDYDWGLEDISVSTGSSQVQGNQQATITITVRNTGNQSWSSTNFPVDIGTWLPTDHDSALYDSSWLNHHRPAAMTENSVLPGNLGHFSFKINPPNRDGSYDESFNLVAEGATWFHGNGYQLHLVISPSYYRWSMVSQSSNTSSFLLLPGQTAQFTLVAKNTGNVSWSNSGANPVRLASWLPTNRSSAFYDSSWILPIRPALLQEASVSPGSNGTFVFTVNAPQKEGFYTEHFNLAMEGVSWFEDPGMEFDINVKRVLTWQMVSQSSDQGFSLTTGQTAQFTLVAKNTGNTTWSNSSNPVRLGTWNLPNRSSVFNNGWTNPARPAVLQEASVAPGGNGTFVFNVKAPSTPGFYVERFNLSMDGISWMVDPWLEFDIRVQ